MQEIAFSIPSSTADGAGNIYVEVNGVKSNELNFTIRDGNIYFISPSGTGDGSSNNPFSPSDYISKLKNGEDGDIAYFRAGIYDGEYAHTGWHANFCLTSEHSGLPGYENAFIAYPGETASIVANTSPADRTNFRLYSNPAQYIIVSKLHLTAENNAVTGHTGWKIIGNYVDAIHQLTGAGSIGTGLYQDNLQNHIYIYGNEITGGSSGNKLDHAIYPGSGVNYLYVGWNYIHDNNFDVGPMISLNCNDAFGQNLTSQDIYFHDNVINVTSYPSRVFGVFETGVNSEIFYYNNIVVGPAVFGSSSAYAMSGTIHYNNNTFYNTGADNMGSTFDFYSSNVSGHDYAPDAIFLRNNIVYSQPNAKFYIRVTGSSPTPTQSNNLWYGLGDYASNNDGGGEDTNMIDNKDPMFTNQSNNDFTLQPTSPAIDAGTNLISSMVTKDFLGISRPQGSAYDVGAYEYIQSSQSDTTPPTLTNGSPSGTLPANTTSTTLSITTNENATCKYSVIANTNYDSMTNTFTTTGGTTHSTTITGLTNGGSYTYYIRCQDTSGNANTTDYPISFSIANPTPSTPSTPTYTITNFISLITHWLGIGDQDSDVNNDGVVNARDLGIIMHYWK